MTFDVVMILMGWPYDSLTASCNRLNCVHEETNVGQIFIVIPIEIYTVFENYNLANWK